MTSGAIAGQTATGVIHRTLQDATSAVVINVHVLVFDQARSQSWEQTTTEQGFFRVPGIACRQLQGRTGSSRLQSGSKNRG